MVPSGSSHTAASMLLHFLFCTPARFAPPVRCRLCLATSEIEHFVVGVLDILTVFQLNLVFTIWLLNSVSHSSGELLIWSVSR